jgi:hypothetical protein
MTERDVERACDRLIAQVGGDVIRTNPPGPTRQHIGLPDRRYRVKGRAFFVELKAPSGKITAEQLAFLRAELDCGCLALCGGVDEVAAMVRRIVSGTQDAALQGWCREIVEAWSAKGLRSTQPAAATARGRDAE